ncbi:hypothetical protein K450DRAFT_246129 [Umbelopsis ramanniana AG]|uniref:Uncharacterized protein n=1 Tax=Umbelopsis ramanniana AG TaxID=1314678 RepID=A0AAD5E7U8_UMBRA|nr:uncharacterized protein K450DRAFT_246129 [Umbelopsis ramanniana AG]KAI8578708.1 hypothetical protein K450DRAFT_246129 [Umbelopsis ramanniana AG]
MVPKFGKGAVTNALRRTVEHTEKFARIALPSMKYCIEHYYLILLVQSLLIAATLGLFRQCSCNYKLIWVIIYTRVKEPWSRLQSH